MTALAVAAPPMRAIAYCRISLDASGEAEGVERQQQTCRELAAREGWDVVEVITDNDVSAFSGVARPGYERLLALIERGDVDAVVAYHSDRLYRRPRDLERLVDVIERGDVRVLTAMSGAVDLSTASGRMVAKMLAVVSEHESARIGERVAAAHKQNAERGRAHGGGRPFGYQRVDGQPGVLVVDETEAALVREAADRILRGSSLNAIVIDWNERGIPTVNGKQWRPNSLSKTLRAGRIAGLREVDGDVLGDGNWEAILDRDTWERLRSRIIHAPIGPRPKRSLLAGMCRCGGVLESGRTCGARMRAMSEGKSGDRGRQYACEKASTGGCGSNSAKAEAVEAVVLEYLFATLPTVNVGQVRARRTVQSSTNLVASIAADEAMLNDLAADLGARIISRGQFLAAQEPIQARLAESRRDLEVVAADSDIDDALFEGLTAESFVHLDLDSQRAVIRAFVDHVRIAKGRPGRTFDRRRVEVIPT